MLDEHDSRLTRRQWIALQLLLADAADLADEMARGDENCVVLLRLTTAEQNLLREAYGAMQRLEERSGLRPAATYEQSEALQAKLEKRDASQQI